VPGSPETDLRIAVAGRASLKGVPAAFAFTFSYSTCQVFSIVAFSYFGNPNGFRSIKFDDTGDHVALLGYQEGGGRATEFIIISPWNNISISNKTLTNTLAWQNTSPNYEAGLVNGILGFSF
jgi:hypothetical protein